MVHGEEGPAPLRDAYPAFPPRTIELDQAIEHAPASADAAAPVVEHSWRAHPLRQRPGAGLLAVGVIAMLGLATGVFAGHPAWGPVAAVVLVLTLNRFFFPSRFSIDAEGITAAYPMRKQRLSWRRVRRLVCDQYGGYLGTRAVPSRMDAWRGMHLIFGDDRDATIAEIRSRLQSEDAA